jgi:raffinose/stachyose/melibiose transport system permease protein
MFGKTRYPLYFVLPALFLYSVLVVLPSILGIGYSFTDWSAYSPEIEFVGLENYERFFSPDENYLKFLSNTLVFTFATIVLKTVFALALAILLSSGVKRFVGVYRTLIYLPAVLPVLIVALIFRSILHPSTGLLNTTFRAVGLDVLARGWLVEPAIALWAVIGVDTWRGIGYIMVILLAGLQSIPKDFYEAARIDGANGWQLFWYVTIPLLMPVIMVVTVLNVLHGLRVFDIVYALTNGGPGYATEVMYTVIFNAFSTGQYGLGTAISSVLFIILVIAGYFVVRLLDRSART